MPSIYWIFKGFVSSYKIFPLLFYIKDLEAIQLQVLTHTNGLLRQTNNMPTTDWLTPDKLAFLKNEQLLLYI